MAEYVALFCLEHVELIEHIHVQPGKTIQQIAQATAADPHIALLNYPTLQNLSVPRHNQFNTRRILLCNAHTTFTLQFFSYLPVTRTDQHMRTLIFLSPSHTFLTLAQLLKDIKPTKHMMLGVQSKQHKTVLADKFAFKSSEKDDVFSQSKIKIAFKVYNRTSK